MKVLVFGKFPPIQGGVSMRTYYYAHGLAALGHDVHLVTNATEVRGTFRMLMRDDDWARCETTMAPGSVTVHWTEPAGIKQYYIPMASPFVTKLVSLGLSAAAETAFDAVFSFYLEPYAVAGHTVARELGLPHVVKTAGSDAGRLWRQPQFRPLYDRIFRAADLLIVGGKVADELHDLGIPRSRFVPDAGHPLPLDSFSREGPVLDFSELEAAARSDPDFADLFLGGDRDDLTWVGVYGKLGESKGSFALLDALRVLADRDLPIGIRFMAHGRPRVEAAFRERVRQLGLEDRVCQIPFLPHWRVPEFVRSCVAVCCLEQGFEIGIHMPIAPREVLASGTCLIASLEMIAKLPDAHRLIDGYNCVVLPDVFDVEDLAARIADMCADPTLAREIGRRGRLHAERIEPPVRSGERLAMALDRARRPSEPVTRRGKQAEPETAFSLARLVATLDPASASPESSRDVEALHRTLMARAAAADPDADADADRLHALAEAVRLDLVLDSLDVSEMPPVGELVHRLDGTLGETAPDRLRDLYPEALAPAVPLRFEADLNQLLQARMTGQLPEPLSRQPTYLLARRFAGHDPSVLVLDEATARLLGACDGHRSVGRLISDLGGDASGSDDDWIARVGLLLEEALIRLRREPPGVPTS